MITTVELVPVACSVPHTGHQSVGSDKGLLIIVIMVIMVMKGNLHLEI